MTEVDDQSAVIDFLSLPSTYRAAGAGNPDKVETIRTHASIIFLAGERAYKLKRAVRYSYLDYASVAAREAACRAELALNRRTAPSLYLDVVPIARDASGLLQLGGKGVPIDWVVEMRRFAQEALFSHLADTNGLDTPLLIRLTDRIAEFHRSAEPTPAQGGAKGIAAVIAINDENLRRSLVDEESVARIDRLLQRTEEAFRNFENLLDARRAEGRVRQCHGDLHLGNICLVEGEPTLFDCIEFSPLISCIDVLYDLAFLLMDLRFRGMTEAAGRVFNRYLDVTGDDDGLPLLPLFLSLRAAVRAHVTATAALGAPDTERPALMRRAAAYLDLANDFLVPRPARLIAIGGLSGSGKSSVAAALAGALGQAPGARVLRSDVIRKQLFGRAPEEKLPPEAYRPGVNERVYATLMQRAEKALGAEQSAIIDAVAARPEERARFAELARRQGAQFTGIWLAASPDRLRARIAARRRDASDATAEVLERQLGYDLGKMDWRQIDAARDIDAVVADARIQLGL
jgi:aminoglycoside phosphotransferase family enzyme/predicted kinase